MAAPVEVSFFIPKELQDYPSRIRFVADKFDRIMKRGQHITGKAILNGYKAASPVRSGRFKNSFRSTVTGRFTKLENVLKEAGFITEGTGIYGPAKTNIQAASGKKMAFQKEGATKFVRFTKGTKPHPLSPPVVPAITKGVEAIIDDVIVILES